MRSKCKKLITDINRGADLDNKLEEYVNILMAQYNLYATVKMCMNYYTMKEMVSDGRHKEAAYCDYFGTVKKIVKKHIVDRTAVDEKAIDDIRSIRTQIEYRMKNLTSYTDGYEIYEYILNRAEARVMGTEEEVDLEQLSAKLFAYVFSENDTVLVNSKLQLIMSQLPVRMTKMKFFDIVARTLAIYTGSEKTSADEFADMIRTAVLVKKPEGFETEYPDLYKLYEDLQAVDYKNISREQFDELNSRLSDAAAIINEEVSVYMLLQEIVNDVYTLLLTVDNSYDTNIGVSGYKSALAILEACVNEDDIEYITERLMPKFIDIEGVQETIYENIMILEAAFDDIRTANKDNIDRLSLKTAFDNCSLIEKLLSTSIFIDINKKESEYEELADSGYINKLRDELIEELTTLFSGKDKTVNRSIMSKLLSSMPIFLNSQQEIRDYFDYVLTNCKDASELTACNKLLCDIMEDK